ncbi:MULTISPECIES: GNAT family N-acetyltransferase [unclassified Streptomyces]|uniref:GNAT family N-acetyltransferase n=1 Tax=unclassified Streptomyces TaxID=2593676 RepID=UPI0020346092|nr:MULTISPECIES: GNAT family N-acetyltransferase [unclassified Streptomyces]MCM2418348.1 GNAT family N-acetyltransferase [Streptomyces sp. RKAG293]MCM2429483.1 GNAT family N-acetyltransferase [Streptomyces sp. RKAG337]
MGMSVTISTADPNDAEKILKLQYLCYQSEAELYGDYTIEPLTQTFEALRAELAEGCVLVARLGDEVVGSVRGVVDVDGTARIAKLIVHPRMQRHGLGGRLLHAVEERLSAESEAKRYRLYTGHRSDLNLRLYRKLGYEQVGDAEPITRRLSLVTMEKDAPPQTFAASA